ncbi:ACT domain-containing protein [Thermodesulfobacteriota bacterium]
MQNRTFSLTVLDEKFGICRLDPLASVPERVYQSSFFSITRTPDELSIVCNEMHIPKAHRCSSGWRCLQVKGPLDLSETGILSALSRPLAEAKIPIFALSTYETDYLLVKEQDLKRAVETLESDGHKIVYIGSSPKELE